MKKGFTLAEVLIVLVIIGVLAAVLMPSMVNVVPDEDLLKFKSANETLHNVIHELVTSPKYYCDGDLGLKSNCITKLSKSVSTTDDERSIYFCQTFAEQIPTKSVNCQRGQMTSKYGHLNLAYKFLDKADVVSKANYFTVTPQTIQKTKKYFDLACKYRAPTMGEEIVATDGTVYYEACTRGFGAYLKITITNSNSGSSSSSGDDIGDGGDDDSGDDVEEDDNEEEEETTEYRARWFSPPGQFPATISDQNGFDVAYKVFCIDIDGIPSNATKNDCVNECPFGYGIRADGKIITGEKADQWLQRSVQSE